LAVSRLRQQPQVVMVTSGPGVTNLITTVADGYYDNTPLIVITGQVGTGDLKRDLPLRQRGFQETDSCALMASITKAQFLVEHQDDLARVMEQAFHIASSGRFGPVLIDMPMNVQRGELTTPAQVPSISNDDQHNDLAGVAELAQWLSAAQRPVIIAGQGVLLAQGHELLRELATTYGIPVSHSLLGLGAMPSDSELALGFHGHTGNQYAGKAIQNSDLVIAIGSRLDAAGPPRIEHATFLDPRLARRIASVGAAVVVQPHFIGLPAFGSAPSIPGLSSLPLRSLLDAGILVAGSSDHPVAGFEPLDGIRSAVTRRTSRGSVHEPEQCLSLDEALAMHTRVSAEVCGCADACGSLEAGKRADVVVLDRLLTPGSLAQTSVRATVIGGELTLPA
jgi:hypothetical protein